MTGGLAALEVARTEGPGSCGLQGRADSAVSLTARVSSSRYMQGPEKGKISRREANKLGGSPWAKGRWRNE